MLKFTYLINFGLAGALIVPSLAQKMGSIEALDKAIFETDQALDELGALEAALRAGDYSAVQKVLRSTEEPFGAARERSILLDQLREEIGRLEAQVEKVDQRATLPHLLEDPTESVDPEATPGGAPTVGLTQEGRDTLEGIWPPIPGSGTNDTVAHKEGDRIKFEEEGFTVDALRQGRAYYRAGRFKEALRLIETRKGEPEADYWIGRCLERLDRTQEAIAIYASVEAAVAGGPLADRARSDREFLEWLIDFDRKVRDLRGEPEASGR